MRDTLVKLAGPHGGGYLLIALAPFALAALAAVIYVLTDGVMMIWDTFNLIRWWLS